MEVDRAKLRAVLAVFVLQANQFVAVERLAEVDSHVLA